MDTNTVQIVPKTFQTNSPMWIVNELARHHKLKAVYKLEKEEGKFQNRKCTFSLSIGEECWYESGKTKKQAQQNVAQKAIQNTCLSFPPEKKKSTINRKALTPTVELNGLSMALGVQVSYSLLSKVQRSPFSSLLNSQQQQLQGVNSRKTCIGSDYYYYEPSIQSMNRSNDTGSGNFQKNFYRNNFQNYGEEHEHGKMVYEVSACLSDHNIFYGRGYTEQSARHDAAKQAIALLKGNMKNPKAISDERNGDTSADQVEGETEKHLKSPICDLYERALPRNFSVVFNTIDESGPSHLKLFTMEVIVGHFQGEQLNEKQQYFKVQARGCSKKQAKQNAALNVLEQMKDLPPIIKHSDNLTAREKKHAVLKVPALINMNLHPVSRLMQISQAKKTKPPSYCIQEEILEEKMPSFTVECTLEGKSALGKGKSKKEAKYVAAEALLALIGYQTPKPEYKSVPDLARMPSKTSLKTNKNKQRDNFSKGLQVKFAENVK